HARAAPPRPGHGAGRHAVAARQGCPRAPRPEAPRGVARARRAREGSRVRDLCRPLACHSRRVRRAQRVLLRPAVRRAVRRAGALGVRLALSGACAPDWPLDEELAGAATAGYAAVELWLPKLWRELERKGPEAVATALKRRNLAAAALAPIADATFRERAGLEAVTAEVHGAAALARAFGASWVVIQPGARPDGADERDALREARHTRGRLPPPPPRPRAGAGLLAPRPAGAARAGRRRAAGARRAPPHRGSARPGRRALRRGAGHSAPGPRVVVDPHHPRGGRRDRGGGPEVARHRARHVPHAPRGIAAGGHRASPRT